MNPVTIVFIACVGLLAAAGIIFAIRSGASERAEKERAAVEGMPAPTIAAPIIVSAPSKPLAQMSGGALFGIIFAALWAFAISASIIYAILHALLDASS